MENLEQKISALSPEKQLILQKRLKQRGLSLEKNFKSSRIAISQREQYCDLPTSFAQQRLWFFQQLNPDNSAYNIFSALHIEGQLNIATLEEVFTEIIKRHESLRTTFITNPQGQPIQVIASAKPIKIPVIDLKEFLSKEQEIQRLAITEARHPFDLEQSSLRITLLKLQQTAHVLFVNMHHIISDRWSIGILVREMKALYEAFSNEQSSPLFELPIQYADWAIWQQQYLQGEVFEKQMAYWKRQLSELSALELPTDRPRPAVATYQGTKQIFELSKELSNSLKALSVKERTTLFTLLLTAFKILLHKYTNQNDIVVGTDIANRNRGETEGLIGFLINTLVLRTDLSGNPTFRQLLSRVRQVTMEAYDHQNLSFDKLVDILNPERDLSQMVPLFQVKFDLQLANVEPLNLSGLEVNPLPLEFDNGTTKFELRFNLQEVDGVITVLVEYSTDLFDATTIVRMLEHFQTLLESIVVNPEKHLSELPLLTEVERHQLLFEWNDTQSEYPSDKCIHQLFEEQVERTPNSVAVVFEGQRLTYRQLNQRANQLAHHLRGLGVKAEVLVGIFVERSLDMVVGLLGILKAGGAYVPLDPNYPQERLSYMLVDSGVTVLLTQQSLLESLPQNQAQTVCLESNWEAFERYSQENLDTGVCSDNLAYVIYTSGSTGQPKGVMNTHQGIHNRLHWMQQTYQLTSSDRILQKTPFSFDVSVWEFFWPLITGARIVVARPEGHKDSAYLVNIISQQQITTIHFVPSMLQVFLQEPNLEPCSYLKRVFCSGEALPSELTQRFFSTLTCELHNLYGPTEAAIDVTFWHCQPENTLLIVPIGRPIANTQIHILDNHLEPVPIGVAGELHIGGDGLARGYLNRPELTHEKFIPNPFSTSKSDRLYKTGDLARYLRDGSIEFLGRIDHQVKIRGFRIELGEIEAVLDTHSQIQQAIVIAREDIPGNKQLVAYLVAKNESPNANQLREFLKQKLPEYMVPSAFVTLETLPLTPNGKIDRKALPVPDGDISREGEYVPPHTSIERTLTNIWQELLLKERVGIYDNFFEIGGDSILSIQVVSRAKNSGIYLTPKQIFQNQTIAELAQIANTAIKAKCKQSIVTGIAPLTPIQHWFFGRNRQDPYHFNQSVLLHLPNDIKPDSLEKAVETLLSHHDALRLRFRAQESECEQINQGLDDAVPFSVVDLSIAPKLSQPQTLEKIATELQASLNLSTGPIIRVVMFSLGNDSGKRLLIIIHHLVVDGVSWRILLSDLTTVYRQLIEQQPIQLSAKTTAFIDWADKLNHYAQSGILKREFDYWNNQPWSKVISLPLDYSHTQQENTVGSTSSVSVQLSKEETRILLESVNTAYNTQINDILLSALALSLGQWIGSSTILVDLEGHGREELFEDVDLTRTVGWFTSLFPVLLQLPSLTDDLSSVIKSIKEQLRSIPSRGVSYGILRYLCADTTVNQPLQTIPTPEVCFNYLGQFDQEQSERSWKPASEFTGANCSLKQTRDHLFDINALVIEGGFQVRWTYSSKVHAYETVEKLAQSYIQAIRSLIKHCQLEDTFGYTPSDFPDAELNQLELDELLEILNK